MAPTLLALERARALCPTPLSVVAVAPGRTLSVLYVARYGSGSSLCYHELIVASALARFEWDTSAEGSRAVRVFDNGQLLCALEWNGEGALPVRHGHLFVPAASPFSTLVRARRARVWQLASLDVQVGGPSRRSWRCVRY